ncbi:conserved hypothetical protein [Streptomyces himastatinicus ATCC 53653]|uniref:PASTA domain-containing protein n=1 Tax=Streptomyces himastatinicus ATCC 53653 TaxID=457427 RepID=D9WCG5_9ACTN|nr:DUF3761 domain-containing protein [Streptomyces himastatinicus]EFL20912.1 conserved hypothetical protein [Streptomyces himastatinicus ATCC 53653]
MNRPDPNNGQDKKKTALGCGCLGLLALVVIGGIGAALDDGGTSEQEGKPTVVAKSGSPSASPSTSPSPSAAAPTTTAPRSSAPAVVKVTLPDFTGQGLQEAQDAAQALGLYRLKSHDLSGLDRFQVWDRNWQVCSQSPVPGRVSESRTITFNVVKNEESCSYRADASTSGIGSGGGSGTGGDDDTSSSGSGSGSSGAGDSSSGGTGGAGSGATALCEDGTLSYAAHHQGACSHHGGVAVFYR